MSDDEGACPEVLDGYTAGGVSAHRCQAAPGAHEGDGEGGAWHESAAPGVRLRWRQAHGRTVVNREETGPGDCHVQGTAAGRVAFEDAVPGKRYRVTWDDCCAEGRFESELLARAPSDDGTVPVESLTFANGVTVRGHGTGLEELPAVAFGAAAAPVGAVVRIREKAGREGGGAGCVLVKTDAGVWGYPYEGDVWVLDDEAQKWMDKDGFDVLWPRS